MSKVCSRAPWNRRNRRTYQGLGSFQSNSTYKYYRNGDYVDCFKDGEYEISYHLGCERNMYSCECFDTLDDE